MCTLKDFNTSIQLYGNHSGGICISARGPHKTRSAQKFMPQNNFHSSFWNIHHCCWTWPIWLPLPTLLLSQSLSAMPLSAHSTTTRLSRIVMILTTLLSCCHLHPSTACVTLTFHINFCFGRKLSGGHHLYDKKQAIACTVIYLQPRKIMKWNGWISEWYVSYFILPTLCHSPWDPVILPWDYLSLLTQGNIFAISFLPRAIYHCFPRSMFLVFHSSLGLCVIA